MIAGLEASTTKVLTYNLPFRPNGALLRPGIDMKPSPRLQSLENKEKSAAVNPLASTSAPRHESQRTASGVPSFWCVLETLKVVIDAATTLKPTASLPKPRRHTETHSTVRLPSQGEDRSIGG